MTEVQYNLDGQFSVKDFEQYFLQNDFSASSDLSPVSFSPSLDQISPQGSPDREQASPPSYIDLPVLSIPPIPTIQPALYNIEPQNYIFEQEPQSHIISIKDEDLAKQNAVPTNSRKRKTVNSRVQIPREELLKMTSHSKESSPPLTTPESRPLTPEEDRMIKRQKRLIKNRESAQLSRLRKKIYIEELERKVSLVSAENKALQDEVMYLRNMIKQLGGVTPPPGLFNTVPQNSPIPNMFSSVGTVSKFPQKNLGTAGVCLLIVLFAFGLFFNNTNDPVSDRPTFLRQPIPEVLPKLTGRTLKSLSSDDEESEEQPDDLATQLVQKTLSKARRAIAEEINQVELALSSNEWRAKVKQELESSDDELGDVRNNAIN